MAAKQKQKREYRSHWHMTSREFQAVTFVTTPALAGMTIILRISDPVIWGFLGTAIGLAIGQAAQRSRNR